MTKSPYPGLRPFNPEEAHLFFGREEQIEQLLGKLSEMRFISVVGLSGCGKSSLVRAGLIPALKSGLLINVSPRWLVVEMRPGNHPLQSLAEALLASLVKIPETLQGSQDRNALPALLASLRRGSLSLVEIFRETLLPKYTNTLILVDQFEELFRCHTQENRDENEAFVNLLLTSVKQDEIPLYAITTMRSEFIGECALFYDLPEIMNKGQFLTPRLTRNQQRDAIVEPAKLFGGTIEPRLVNTLLNEMGTDPDQLPVLQHCLMRMWFYAHKKISSQKETSKFPDSSSVNGVSITQEDYEAVGSLKNALSNHADEAYNELHDERKKIAEIMFRCLTEGDRCRPVVLSEVANVARASEAEVKEVTKVFRQSERCFLRPYGNERLQADSMLDISHESLIRQWKQLNKWVAQEAESAETYQRLEQTARLWKEGKSALWSTPDLDITIKWKEEEHPTSEWAKRYGKHFDLSIQFLDASAKAQEEKRLQEEQRRRKEFLRKLVYAGFVVAIVVVIISVSLAFWALRERSDAKKAKAETEFALIETEKAKAVAETALKEAKEARKLAEEQKQQALEAEKNAKKAQEEAELNSSRFQEMVNATFGFLTESGQNGEFLDWAEKTSTTEKLNPVLLLMIDLSESMNEEEKRYWHRELSIMAGPDKLNLLDRLGREAIGQIRVGDEFYIRQMIIRNAKGEIIKPVNSIYFIKLGETVTITVDFTNPYKHKIEVAWTALHGKILPVSEKVNTYTAENPGGDYVIVFVLDKDTGKELQQPINITIVP